MTVERLDEKELDDEDRAILAELKKTGYYHGRPKSEATPPPRKLDVVAPSVSVGPAASRTQFDEFQKKWDRWDREDFVAKAEPRSSGGALHSSGHATMSLSARSWPFHEFVIVVVGDRGVGKTAFVTGDFWHAKTKSVPAPSLRIRSNCGDVGFKVRDGGEMSDVQGAIIMFDLTAKATYDSTFSWLQTVRRACGSIPTILVGNKADKAVTQEFNGTHADQHYAVSSTTGRNAELVLLWFARRFTNQPDLEFIGPVAVQPSMRVDATRQAEHKRLFAEACKVSVTNEMCGF